MLQHISHQHNVKTRLYTCQPIRGIQVSVQHSGACLCGCADSFGIFFYGSDRTVLLDQPASDVTGGTTQFQDCFGRPDVPQELDVAVVPVGTIGLFITSAAKLMPS
jgi:hypothetical protein